MAAHFGYHALGNDQVPQFRRLRAEHDDIRAALDYALNMSNHDLDAAIIATSVWWVTGYYLVLYLAALQDIPTHLYEAAAIDGAGAWRRFWSITLPLLRPIILLVVVLHIIGSFQLFGQVFVLTQGGPANATRTVVQTLYETGFKDLFDFGAASAMSWVLFAIILVVSLVQFRLLRSET